MTPPRLTLNPSRLEQYWRKGIHLAAASVALLLPLAWLIPALLAICLHYYLTRHPPAHPQYLQTLPDGKVRATWQDGSSSNLDIRPSSLVTPILIILHLADANTSHRLALWPDSAPADSLRQWRVWLRWHWPALTRKTPDQHQSH